MRIILFEQLPFAFHLRMFRVDITEFLQVIIRSPNGDLFTRTKTAV